MAESSDQGKTRRTCLAIVFAVFMIPSWIGIAIFTLMEEGMPLYEKIGKIGLAMFWLELCVRLTRDLPRSKSVTDRSDVPRGEDQTDPRPTIRAGE